MPLQLQSVNVNDLYRKFRNLKPEDVKILQEWLKKQQHLPQLQEYQIMAFLECCDHKIEPVKATIDKFFTMKTHHPEIFNSLSEDLLRQTFKYALCTILPQTTPEGYAVMIIKLVDSNPELYNFTHTATLVAMVMSLYLHQKGFEDGGMAIFDSKGYTFSHMTKINLSVLKHSLEFVQEAAPIRMKGIHFVNVVPAVEKIMVMVKPFLKSELLSMIEFHSTFDTLHKKVSKTCLPEDYGGEGPSCQILHERNSSNMLENFEFFRWHDTLLVDETKRMGEVKGSTFGVAGTFKKIEID